MVDMWLLKIKMDIMTEPFEVKAADVDFMHPIISIKGIQSKSPKSSILTLPESNEDIELSKFKTLLVPYTNVIFAGEYKDEEEQKVIQLKIPEKEDDDIA
jgi:hypothetical protein